MDQKDYLKFHKDFTSRMYQIVESDSRGSENGDPFTDFMFVEDIGVCSALYGYLINKSDRFRKIVKYLKRGVDKFPMEAIEETLLEEANYNVLLAAYLKDMRTKKSGEEEKKRRSDDTGNSKEDSRLPPSERRDSESENVSESVDKLGRESIIY